MPQRVVRENNRKRQAQDSQLPTQSCWGDGAGLLLFLCFGNFCKKSPTALFLTRGGGASLCFGGVGGLPFGGSALGQMCQRHEATLQVYTLSLPAYPPRATLSFPKKVWVGWHQNPKLTSGVYLLWAGIPRNPRGCLKVACSGKGNQLKPKFRERSRPSGWATSAKQPPPLGAQQGLASEDGFVCQVKVPVSGFQPLGPGACVGGSALPKSLLYVGMYFSPAPAEEGVGPPHPGVPAWPYDPLHFKKVCPFAFPPKKPSRLKSVMHNHIMPQCLG